MTTQPAPSRVTQHVAAFNDAVRTGRWAQFADRFATDATMSFQNVPAGPFQGRVSIRDAYVAQPPDDTMTVTHAVNDGDTDEVSFAWDGGGTGTMRMTWRDGLLTRLEIVFPEVID